MDIFDIAIAKALGGGGGGGKTTKTVTGTLANPWGDLDHKELETAIMNQNAFVNLTIDASALGAGEITSRPSADEYGMFTNGASVTSYSVSAYGIEWNGSGSLSFAAMSNNGTYVDISPYATALPTTMTVVYIS